MGEYEVRLNELKAKILDAELAWTKAKKSMEEAISMQKELLSSTEKIDEAVNEMENVASPVAEVSQEAVVPVEGVSETSVEEAPQEAVAPVESVPETPVEEAPQEAVAPAESVPETPVKETPQEAVAPVEGVPETPVKETPQEAVAPVEVTVPAENDLSETPVQIIPPIEEQAAPVAPVSDVVDSSKEEVVLPAIEPTVPGVSDTENKVEEQPAVSTPVVNDVTNADKETYKKDYDNVDKKILVNTTQAEKLRASRETQKGLFNNANTIGESKDLEAMVNEMQELYDKGETEKAESLSNEVQKKLQMQKQSA